MPTHTMTATYALVKPTGRALLMTSWIGVLLAAEFGDIRRGDQEHEKEQQADDEHHAERAEHRAGRVLGRIDGFLAERPTVFVGEVHEQRDQDAAAEEGGEPGAERMRGPIRRAKDGRGVVRAEDEDKQCDPDDRHKLDYDGVLGEPSETGFRAR